MLLLFAQDDRIAINRLANKRAKDRQPQKTRANEQNQGKQPI